MANRKIIDVDVLSSLADDNSLLVNADGYLTQVPVNDSGLTRMEVVWVNASPTSDLVANTSVPVATRDYDYVVVEAAMLTSASYVKTFWALVPKSTTAETNVAMILDFPWGASSKIINYYRAIRVYPNEGTINFGTSWTSNTTQDAATTNTAIPVRIYGIKGIQQ